MGRKCAQFSPRVVIRNLPEMIAFFLIFAQLDPIWCKQHPTIYYRQILSEFFPIRIILRQHKNLVEREQFMFSMEWKLNTFIVWEIRVKFCRSTSGTVYAPRMSKIEYNKLRGTPIGDWSMIRSWNVGYYLAFSSGFRVSFIGLRRARSSLQSFKRPFCKSGFDTSE